MVAASRWPGWAGDGLRESAEDEDAEAENDGTVDEGLSVTGPFDVTACCTAAAAHQAAIGFWPFASFCLVSGAPNRLQLELVTKLTLLN